MTEMTKVRMTPKAREDWLIKRIQQEIGACVDVLNNDFVRDYIEAAGANYRETMWGAPKCPQLGKDLSRMATEWGARLKRSRTSLGDMGTGLGFPRWVWSYRVSPYWAEYLAKRERGLTHG